MAYVTNDDIVLAVGTETAVQLTDGTGSTPDSDVLDEVRLMAEGEADGYLGRRYAVPVNLTTHPELAGVLKGMVLRLAVYWLFGRKPPPPEQHEKGYNYALKWLERVAKGEIVLPATTTPAATTSDEPTIETGSSPMASGRGNMAVGTRPEE